MITFHTDKSKAYKDREYWARLGYAVGILHPAEGDEWYTVYADLKGGMNAQDAEGLVESG